MQKTALICCILSLFVSLSPSAAQADEPPCYRLAVFDFDPMLPFMPTDWAVRLPEALSFGITENKILSQVDRQYLNKILEEQSLSSSDLASPEARLTLGKISGADKMIFGAYMLDDTLMKVAVRLVDTATSEVLVTRAYDLTTDNAEDEMESFGKIVQNRLSTCPGK